VESLLITACRASLPDDQGQTLRVPTGVADFYAEEPGGSVIIEAKSSAQHPFVRQALSQLLDYKRFSPRPVTRLAALFPRRPDRHGIELLHEPGLVRQLKSAAEHDMRVGGADLAGQAIKAGLADEVRLFLVPVVVGGG
jgi:riboflavin biosynthesis pyrimidine reductase